MSFRGVELMVTPLDQGNEEEMRFLYDTRRHKDIVGFLLGEPPVSMEAHRSWVAANVPSRRRMYLARMGSRLAGYCHAYGFDKEGPVEVGFVVHPDWQGKGVGGMMVDWMICETGKVFPGRGVMLKVRSDNVKAKRIYEKRGFVCVQGGDVATYVRG